MSGESFEDLNLNKSLSGKIQSSSNPLFLFNKILNLL